MELLETYHHCVYCGEVVRHNDHHGHLKAHAAEGLVQARTMDYDADEDLDKVFVPTQKGMERIRTRVAAKRAQNMSQMDEARGGSGKAPYAREPKEPFYGMVDSHRSAAGNTIGGIERTKEGYKAHYFKKGYGENEVLPGVHKTIKDARTAINFRHTKHKMEVSKAKEKYEKAASELHEAIDPMTAMKAAVMASTVASGVAAGLAPHHIRKWLDARKKKEKLKEEVLSEGPDDASYETRKWAAHAERIGANQADKAYARREAGKKARSAGASFDHHQYAGIHDADSKEWYILADHLHRGNLTDARRHYARMSSKEHAPTAMHKFLSHKPIEEAYDSSYAPAHIKAALAHLTPEKGYHHEISRGGHSIFTHKATGLKYTAQHHPTWPQSSDKSLRWSITHGAKDIKSGIEKEGAAKGGHHHMDKIVAKTPALKDYEGHHYVMAHRHTDGAAAPVKDIHGRIKKFKSEEEARAHAGSLNKSVTSTNVSYRYGGTMHNEEFELTEDTNDKSKTWARYADLHYNANIDYLHPDHDKSLAPGQARDEREKMYHDHAKKHGAEAALDMHHHADAVLNANGSWTKEKSKKGYIKTAKELAHKHGIDIKKYSKARRYYDDAVHIEEETRR